MFARLALATVVVAAYTALGMVTYGTTAANTAQACVATPGYAAHVALWPLSYGSSAGLQSDC